MSWRTNSFIISVRSITRSLGINKLFAPFILGVGYESKYDEMLSKEIQEGDCVWDVGANIGYYTKIFSVCVGDQGCVYAFEPSPVNFSRLTQNNLNNVKYFSFGLGSANGKVLFEQGADEIGATSRVVDNPGNGISVEIKAAESVIRNGLAKLPNVLKIDVEGYESEVLEGLNHYLSSPNLRVIGVEIHFGILNERAMSNAPKNIEVKLKGSGFRLIWSDSSHLLAIRPRQ